MVSITLIVGTAERLFAEGRVKEGMGLLDDHKDIIPVEIINAAKDAAFEAGLKASTYVVGKKPTTPTDARNAFNALFA